VVQREPADGGKACHSTSDSQESRIMTTPLNQPSKRSVERKMIDLSCAWNSSTGELECVRIKLEQIPPPAEVSSEQFVYPTRFFKGGTGTPGGVGIISRFAPKFGRWTVTHCISTADVLRRFIQSNQTLRDLIVELTRENRPIYEVCAGMGEQITTEADEIFLFGIQPPAMAAIEDANGKSNWLSEWVSDLIGRERESEEALVQAEAEAINAPKLIEYPAQLPHEPPQMDHYKNRQDVLWMLLGRTWPRLFKVMDKLKTAKTEAERTECRKLAMIAYLSDHKAIYGRAPEVRPNEAMELWRSENYVRTMNDALTAPKPRVDKIDWQLADGWIEKNYYRMDEAQLEESFTRDWNYTAGLHKGNTLAKRAHRKLGLQSALPKGRRPIHKFDDSALKMRT